ncbi:hypothetical protein BsWGS_28737 [Bradybaena similaris]
MTTENSGERRGLHQSLRSQMGYGTASQTLAPNKTTPKTRKFISRRLLRTDTLMGITLKYGVTIQELKKENKLWNNDHLFLRENLLIPLTPENEGLLDENDTIVVCDGSSSSAASPSSPHSHLPNGDLVDSPLSPSSQKSSGVHHSGSSHGGISNGASTSTSSSSKPTSSTSDFFAKYDTSIARLKGDVAKMEKNAAHLEGIIDANPLALPPRKGSGASRRDSSSSSSSMSERRGRFLVNEDSNSSPVLLIRSRTSSRQIKSTIENHEQVNDDLYEL